MRRSTLALAPADAESTSAASFSGSGCEAMPAYFRCALRMYSSIRFTAGGAAFSALWRSSPFIPLWTCARA